MPAAHSSYSYVSPLEPYQVQRLKIVLCEANERFSNVAAYFRASLRPTDHARKLARRKGLEIDIMKAVACDQRHVSNIPLPIIEQTYSPHRVLPAFRTEPILTPLRNVAILTTSPGGTINSLSTGALSSISLMSPAGDTPDIPIASGSPRGSAAMGEWYPLNIPVDVEVAEWETYLGSEMSNKDHVEQQALDLDWDIEWESDVSVEGILPHLIGLPSISSSAALCHSPTVPADFMCNLSIRIKRKLAEMRDDIGQAKRPKRFGDLSGDSDQRCRNIIQIPARRRLI